MGDLMNEYETRNETLRGLGFASYKDYLLSPLWRSIRRRALTRDKRRCRKCHGWAKEVHHTDYRRATLRGICIRGLWSVCRNCHQHIEDSKREGKNPHVYMPEPPKPQKKRRGPTRSDKAIAKVRKRRESLKSRTTVERVGT